MEPLTTSEIRVMDSEKLRKYMMLSRMRIQMYCMLLEEYHRGSETLSAEEVLAAYCSVEDSAQDIINASRELIRRREKDN